MFKANTNKPDTSSAEYMQTQFNGARSGLLLAIVFTVINMILMLIGADMYFLFSIAVPYYGVAIGASISSAAMGVMLVIGVIILAFYVVCWLAGKKHRSLMTLALIFFCIDTLIVLILALTSGAMVEFIVDIIFHVLVLISLIRGVRFAKKLNAHEREAQASTMGPEIP